MKSEFLTGLSSWTTWPRVLDAVESLAILLIGLVVAKLLSAFVARLFKAHSGEQLAQVAGKFTFYVVVIIFLLTALENSGIDLGVLLGAAGILTMAIGFASQTAASNLISGLFLLGERPFVVGEVIKVAGTTGEVLSIDLLGVKLRTYDNIFVRIPNETLIKSEISNISRFPIRRADLKIGIAYKEDVECVKKVLEELASANPLCLEHPKPLFILSGFGDSSIDIQFSVWAISVNFLELRNTMYQEIKRRFDELDIEIPFPHVSIYSGLASEPFDIVVAPDAKTTSS